MEKNKLLNLIQDNIAGGFIIYNSLNYEIKYVNDQLIKSLGFIDQSDFLNHFNNSIKNFISKYEFDDVNNQINQQLESGLDNFLNVRFHVTDKNNKIHYLESYGKKVEVDNEIFYYIYIVDIDKKILTYDFDSVTGLPGMRRFLDYSKKMVESMKNSPFHLPYSVVYLNLVYFKTFNLRFGIKAGDQFLKDLAQAMHESFPNNLVARLSDDNFAIFTDNTRIELKIKKLNETIMNKYGFQKIIIKAGVYVLNEEDEDRIDLAIDNAKRACYSLDFDDEHLFKIYDEDMKLNQKIYDYVTSNIDEAIKNGEIKVYYQPVIRTLTGKLASAEALARWETKEFGLLYPNKFITPLENTRQIDKLDSYMLNEICKNLRSKIDMGIGVIPVSFNLSRLDFVLMDPYKLVIDTLEKYTIPHELIKIEITETIIMLDPDAMKEIISKFRKTGIEIWMDDFGSAYSSLNMLKDFELDEIKLDMAFINVLSDKSKSIVKNSVAMAKDLKIQTLAEGVENLEQLNFLKEIGCEKVQGHLFSKPKLYDDMILEIKNKGIELEKARYREYYNRMSNINFLTDFAISIVHSENKIFEVYFMNDKFKSLLKEFNLDSEIELQKVLNNESSIFRQRLINSDYFPKLTKEEKNFIYSYQGNLFKIKILNISHQDINDIYLATIINLSSGIANQINDLDTTIREVSHIYDSISKVNINEDTIYALIDNNSKKVESENVLTKFKDSVEYMTEFVYPQDLKRYKEFVNSNTLIDKIKNSGCGYVVDYFRFYNEKHEILWKNLMFLQISRPEDGKFILLTRRLTRAEELHCSKIQDFGEIQALLNKEKNKDISPFEMFKSIIKNTDSLYYWKDLNRRYVGCSDSFLKIYGFTNENDIDGKTDEDLGWNITNNAFLNDEIKVLNTGRPITNSIGVTIINGVGHSVICSLWPIYSSGKVNGLFGIMRLLEDNSQNYKLTLIDNKTGLLNPRGYIESLLSYMAEYRKYNSEITQVIVKLTRLAEVEVTLGADIAEQVEFEVANILKNNFGKDSTIVHFGFSVFVLLLGPMSKEEKDKLCKDISNKLYETKQVTFIPLTIFNDVEVLENNDENITAEEFNLSVYYKLIEMTKKFNKKS